MSLPGQGQVRQGTKAEPPGPARPARPREGVSRRREVPVARRRARKRGQSANRRKRQSS
jgi:hypothetical protein